LAHGVLFLLTEYVLRRVGGPGAEQCTRGAAGVKGPASPHRRGGREPGYLCPQTRFGRRRRVQRSRTN
jgi:hypothetical protein